MLLLCDIGNMDLSAAHFNGYQDTGRLEPGTMYPSFAAPTPLNLSKSYHGNTLTPGKFFNLGFFFTMLMIM